MSTEIGRHGVPKLVLVRSRDSFRNRNRLAGLLGLSSFAKIGGIKNMMMMITLESVGLSDPSCVRHIEVSS